MSDYKKPRDAASEALIDLRTKMGKTQASFAVEVLKTAVTTIARYETSHRPPGEMLLRLSDIAQKQGFEELRSQFRLFYLEDVLKAVGSQVTVIPATGNVPAHGYITAPLTNGLAIRAASALLHFATATSMTEKKQKALGVAIEALEEAAFMNSIFAKKGKR